MTIGLGVYQETGQCAPALSHQAVVDLFLKKADRHRFEQQRQMTQAFADQAQNHMGVIYGVDPTKLSEAGWGLIFPKKLDQRPLLEALEPLIQQRGDDQGVEPKIFTVAENQSAEAFLQDHGVGDGPVDPKRGIPYYLLIIGDPRHISFEFQYQLDVQFAVGRLWFHELSDFNSYAERIARRHDKRKARLGVFAPHHPDDPATHLTTNYLAEPLRQVFKLEKHHTALGVEATKTKLKTLIGGHDTPDLLFSVHHGLMFHPEAQALPKRQGAVICAEWGGPVVHQQVLTPDMYYAAEDVSGVIGGLIHYCFSCFGAGWNQTDDFAFLNQLECHPGARNHKAIAPNTQVAALPQRMLAQGAAAVLAHVDRAFESSFYQTGTHNIGDVQSVIGELLEGRPIGLATEHLNHRYAQIGALLANDLLMADAGMISTPDISRIASRWIDHQNLRNHILLGDPAVRI